MVADLAATGRLLGDQSRAAMSLAMLDGRPWTVSELAAQAGIGKAAASEHVSRLIEGGLVRAERQGRCKYVRLAGPEVAALLETLSAVRTPAQGDSGSLSVGRRRRQFAAARTCYDHLAGRLGVAVYDAMVAGGHLRTRDGLAVTRRGRSWLAELGMDVAGLVSGSRVLVRDCLDVTERRPHLAGAVGAALCATFLDRDWVRPVRGSRALLVTPIGERALEAELGVLPAVLSVEIPA
jgi:DNA-binding transcriptional ArsR family regulator